MQYWSGLLLTKGLIKLTLDRLKLTNQIYFADTKHFRNYTNLEHCLIGYLGMFRMLLLLQCTISSHSMNYQGYTKHQIYFHRYLETFYSKLLLSQFVPKDIKRYHNGKKVKNLGNLLLLLVNNSLMQFRAHLFLNEYYQVQYWLLYLHC